MTVTLEALQEARYRSDGATGGIRGKKAAGDGSRGQSARKRGLGAAARPAEGPQAQPRAGRGEKSGRALIQTYTPDNDVIRFSARQDYDRFYDGEIRLRQLRRDPPFADQFFITVTGPQEGPVRRAAAGLRDGLRSAAGQEPYRGMALDILGPAPAPVVKVNNRYRYRVTVIGRNDKTLRGLLSAFMKEFSRRPEHKALHIYTDCNLMD